MIIFINCYFLFSHQVPDQTSNTKQRRCKIVTGREDYSVVKHLHPDESDCKRLLSALKPVNAGFRQTEKFIYSQKNGAEGSKKSFGKPSFKKNYVIEGERGKKNGGEKSPPFYKHCFITFY
jgi:hypothetical protein